MATFNTPTKRTCTLQTLLWFTLLYSAGASSQDVRLFNWTEPTVGGRYLGGKNYNRPKGNAWGITNRSDEFSSNKVLPYMITDPGMSGPDGEVYGVELEFGSLAILPRSINSRSVKHYVDCGQTGFQERKHDRSEMHMRRLFEEMDINEGDSLWLGWSEFYRFIDKTRTSTILQFRNQPSLKGLLAQGVITLDSNALKTAINGGPAIAIELWPVKNEVHYHFAVRNGTPSKWTIPSTNKFTIKNPLKEGVWYDFIVNLKYSRTDNGYFRVWHRSTEDSQGPLRLNNPTWQYTGTTMYQYPVINGVAVKPEPSLRWGLYRYGCKETSLKAGKPPIDENNRYMTKFLGPIRLWKGESESGFELVKPRD